MAIHTTPDSYTKLLIHSNTSDGSTTFVDSSAGGHTITAAATAQHDTAQVKFGATSMLFDGDSDYLTIADNSDWDFGTGDFTIDFWLRLNSTGGNKNYISRRDASNDTLWFFRTENGPEYQFYWKDGSSNAYYNMLGGTPETNVWHHLAIVRSGREVKMYEDGIVIDTHTESTPRSYDGGEEVLVGARYSGGVIQFLDGWLDELRVSKGIARWTDSFVPPNKPYSVVDDDFVTDAAGIEDDGSGNTTFGRDIIVKSNPDEASTDTVFSVQDKVGTPLLEVRADGIVTKPNNPAFLARASSDQQNLSINSTHTVSFGTEVFDQNGDFASNTFTAPVTGKYYFDFHLRLQGLDSAAEYYQLNLVTSNRTYSAWVLDPDFGQDNVYFPFGGSVLADMDSGDTAHITIHQGGGSAQADIGGGDTQTFFSGYLVC